MIQPANGRLDIAGEMRRALQILFAEDQVIEVRAFGKFAPYSGHFKDTGRLVQAAEALDTLPGLKGIYVVLNRFEPDLFTQRVNHIVKIQHDNDTIAGDADIIRRCWLPINIEPKRANGVPSSREEHALSFQKAQTVASWLQDIGFPEPVVGDSGNGSHLLYKIDLPNTDQERELIKNCIESIAFFHSDEVCSIDTTIHNAGLLWKLYGTVTREGANSVERPHRRSRLISVPGNIEQVEQEVLKRLASLLLAPEYTAQYQDEQHRTTRDACGNKYPIDLRAWLEDHSIFVKSEKTWGEGTLYVLDQCPFSNGHRSGAYAIQFSNGNIFASCLYNSCGGGEQRWPELRERYEDIIPWTEPSCHLPNSAHTGTQIITTQQCAPQSVTADSEPITSVASVPSIQNPCVPSAEPEISTNREVKTNPPKRSIDELILLCVYLIEEENKFSFGREQVVNILLGSWSKKIFKYNHNELVVFGEGRCHGKVALKRRLEELTDAGYITYELIRPRGAIRVVKITSQGREYLAQLRPGLDEKLPEKDILDLIEDLSSIDYAKRRNAAEALGNYGDRCAVDPLIQVLSDSDLEVIFAGVIALSKLRDSRAVNPLLQLLDHHEPAVQGLAIDALGELGERRTCEALVKFLYVEDPDLVEAALEAIAKLQEPDAYERVLEIYKMNITIDRRSVIRALLYLGDPRGRDVCISLLRDVHPFVRKSAAEALGEFGGIAAVEHLIKSLTDLNARVRSAAACSLGILGFEKALEPLTSLLDDENEGVRSHAQEAIELIRKRKDK